MSYCFLILSRRVGLRIEALRGGIHKQSSAGLFAENFHRRNDGATITGCIFRVNADLGAKLKSALDCRRPMRDNGASDECVGENIIPVKVAVFILADQ